MSNEHGGNIVDEPDQHEKLNKGIHVIDEHESDVTSSTKILDDISYAEPTRIVGCVGCFVRSAEDLAQVTPSGKEYLRGRDNSKMQPLWAPVGVAGTLGDCCKAVELIRMAVHKEFRGKGAAEMLVTAVAEYAISKGCAHVVLSTGRYMAKAVKAYKRLGLNGHEISQYNVVYGAKSHDLIRLHQTKM